MKKLSKRFIIITIIVVGMVAAAVWYYSARQYSGGLESITLANIHQEATALIYIAEDKQYFSKTGLALTIKDYATGVATIDAMLKGEADLASMTEFVMSKNASSKQRVSVLGAIGKSITVNFIGRKSRGISNISDLAGKRIGLARKTIAEFYLGRSLELHGMNIRDVVLVDLPPEKWMDAFSSGEVDAIIGWSPFVLQIQKRFTDETINWEAQSDQPLFAIIVGGNNWIAAHPEAIVRFWKSLAQAEKFLTLHPDEAKTIVRKRLDYDSTYIETVWPQNTFSLSLDQSLVAAMEDEARWMIANRLTDEKIVPDFGKYIYVDGLKTVKPEAVNIIK